MARATALHQPPAPARMRPGDFLITPADALAWARALGARDLWGLGLMATAGFVIGWWLGDAGAGVFAAGLVLALWWRVDSRWPFGAALTLLVLIPLMQFTYDRNWLFSGSDIAGGLAVAVWYLLAIGVVRQLLELRAIPPTPGVAPAAAPASTRAAAPLAVPAWRRRLAAIERESAAGAARPPSMDGLRHPQSPPSQSGHPARKRHR